MGVVISSVELTSRGIHYYFQFFVIRILVPWFRYCNVSDKFVG